MAILQWIYNTIRLIHVGSMALFFLPFLAPQSFLFKAVELNIWPHALAFVEDLETLYLVL